jgi:hypothetical protein
MVIIICARRADGWGRNRSRAVMPMKKSRRGERIDDG